MRLSYENDFKSHRPDGRFVSHLAAHMEMLRNYKPILRLPDELTTETFVMWQGNVKKKLSELLCLPDVTKQPAPVCISREQRDGYRVEKWELYPDDYCAVPFLMLVPDKASETNKVPVVLCQPGANTSKEWLAGEELSEINKKRSCAKKPERNRMALYMVKNGMSAIVFDNPGTAECAVGDMMGISSGQMCFGYLQYGINYPGITTFQLMLALDFAKTLDFIDKTRMAVSAHSLGTVPALFLGLLRDEIKAVVFNDYMCDPLHRFAAVTEEDETAMDQNTSDWHLMPGFWKWFSHQDLLAAFAPRYLALNEGGATQHMKPIIRTYEFVGAPDHLRITQYPKYADPKARVHEDFLPYYGLNIDEYHECCYVDVPDHSFREGPSIALLKDCFGL